MNKYFFTFGDDPRFPFPDGWVEVESPERELAIRAFKTFHPDRDGTGVVNCADFYSESEFRLLNHSANLNTWHGKCHERITVVHTRDHERGNVIHELITYIRTPVEDPPEDD